MQSTAVPGFFDDQPTTEDKLGRESFAKALAVSLMVPRAESGLVIGIEGRWGSGKSTLINLIVKELRTTPPEKAPIVVSFNPWMISATGALIEALISQIAVAIGADKSAGEKGVKVGEKLLGYIGVFNKLKYLKYVPGTGWAGNIFEALEGVLDVSEKAAEHGKQALDEVKKLLPELDLKAKKDAVGQALKDFGRPIVVVIDDLDRLLPAEIQSVIQAIKAVADFPETTYLLAYDRSIVAAALGKDEQVGLEYLAKIVQVAYPIPPLFNRQRAALISAKLIPFLATVGIELSAPESALWNQSLPILSRLLPQPRDVIRLLNRLVVSVPATRGEVNTIDVIVFEAISLRFPAVADTIYKHPGDFTGGFRENDHRVVTDRYMHPTEQGGNDRGKWEHYLPADAPGVSEACDFLFEQSSKRSYSGAQYLRIASGDRLARLLRMTSIAGVPDVRQVQDMLAFPDKLAQELDGCGPEEAVIFLSWVRSYIVNCHDIDVIGNVRVLLEYVCRINANGVEVTDVTSSVEALIKLFMAALQDSAEDILAVVVADAPLDLAVDIVGEAALTLDNRQKRGQDVGGNNHAGLSNPAIVRAVALLRTRLQGWIGNGGRGTGGQVHQFLLCMKQILGSTEEMDRIMHKLATDDEWFELFLSGFAQSPNLQGSWALVPDLEEFAARIKGSVTLMSSYDGFLEGVASERVIMQHQLGRDRQVR